MFPMAIISQLRVIEKVGIKKLSVYGSSSVILSSDNKLYAYGSNTSGKFGTGDTTTLSTLTLLMENVSDCALGSNTLIVIKMDGTVWMAGAYLLYVGMSPSSSTTFVDCTDKFTVAMPIKKIEIATASAVFYVLKDDGTLYVTGSSSNGILGLGSTSTYITTLTQLDTDVKNFKSGNGVFFYIKNSGSLYGTGSNSNYIINSSSTTPIYSPTLVQSGVLDFQNDLNCLLYNTVSGVFCRGYVESYYGSTVTTAQTPIDITSFLPFTYDSNSFKFISNLSISGGYRGSFIYCSGSYYVCGRQSGTSTGSSRLGIGTDASTYQYKYILVSIIGSTDNIFVDNQNFSFYISDGKMFITGIHNALTFPFTTTIRTTIFALESIQI